MRRAMIAAWGDLDSLVYPKNLKSFSCFTPNWSTYFFPNRFLFLKNYIFQKPRKKSIVFQFSCVLCCSSSNCLLKFESLNQVIFRFFFPHLLCLFFVLCLKFVSLMLNFVWFMFILCSNFAPILCTFDLCLNFMFYYDLI